MEESQGDEIENSVEMILVKLIFRLFFVQKVKETMIINLSVSSNAYPEFCKFLFIFSLLNFYCYGKEKNKDIFGSVVYT